MTATNGNKVVTVLKKIWGTDTSRIFRCYYVDITSRYATINEFYYFFFIRLASWGVATGAFLAWNYFDNQFSKPTLQQQKKTSET